MVRQMFVREPTGARVNMGIVALGEPGIAEFPSVDGYNLCFTKPDAEEMVTTTDQNAAPLLAAWRRGVGRAAALTAEVDGPFTGELALWADYQPFLSSLTKWLRAERDEPGLFATVVRRGRTARAVLEMDAPTAAATTGATALLIPPDENDPLPLPMRWAGPDRMEVEFPLRSGGVYHGVVVTREGRRAPLPPVVLPYSPEYEPRPPGAGAETLPELAAATGGRRVLHVRDLLETPAAVSRREASLAAWPAALLLLLVLADIATRKHVWSFLVPQFVLSGTARSAEAARRLVEQTPVAIKRTAAAEHKAPDEPGRPEPPPDQGPPVPAGEAEQEPNESVFKRAKRRSRGR
jgi:hypothetical protein